MYKNNSVKPKIPLRQKIILTICSILLCVILLEIGLRLGGFIFLSLQEYSNRISLYKKGIYRIMCLGESTTTRQYPSFLEDILNQCNIGVKFSVIDKGVIATNTAAILLRLEENLNKYKPDMVITMMGNNDKYIMYYKDIPEANTKLFQYCRVYRFMRLIYMHILNRLKEKGIYGLMNRAGSRRRAKLKKIETIAEENFFSSEESLKKAIELNPKNDSALSRLGEILRCEAKFSQAEELFKKAIELNPQNVWARNGLVGLYWEQGELSKAEEVLKRFLAINPKNDWAYRTLESLYREMNRIELAQEYKKKRDELRLNEYSAITINNYRKLKEILDKRRIQLVCVQYPMRSVEPLKKIFKAERSVKFVDNESVFKEALKRSSYIEYFRDSFGGDFGHCTPKGNRLLAGNIANVILKEVFGK